MTKQSLNEENLVLTRRLRHLETSQANAAQEDPALQATALVSCVCIVVTIPRNQLNMSTLHPQHKKQKQYTYAPEITVFGLNCWHSRLGMVVLGQRLVTSLQPDTRESRRRGTGIDRR